MELRASFSCPKCGHIVSIRVEDMIPGLSKPCPKCHIAIRFTGDDGRKAQRAVDHLENTLKKLAR
jgi:hypothetical protein